MEPLLKRIQQLERLLELSRSLNAMQDEKAILQTIVDVAAEITNSQEASILLYDDKQNDLHFVAAHLYKRDAMKNIRVQLKNSIAGEVFRYCSPIVVHDAQSDPRFSMLVDQRTDFLTHSMLGVPMTFQGTPIGVLSAANKLGEGYYSDDDVRIMESLASQAAVTIKNANLLRDTQESYEELAEFDRKRTDFIAITSHELRTPLGLILGHATFLSETAPEELKPQLEVIVRSSLRLKDIAEDLSKVNTYQKGKARFRSREININLLLQDILAQYKQAVEAKQINLRSRLPSTKLIIEGDSEKIAIAVNHLLKNAVSFVDNGGTVEVLAEAVPGYVKISVIDDGVGVPEKDLDRIFDRFYQVEEHMTRKHGGMGLGLSVAQMMVEMHGGRISVKSVEGEGSNFSILLPTNQTQRAAAQRVFNP